MKTETLSGPQTQSYGATAGKRITVKGKRMVMLDEAEYDRLLQKADEWEPSLPPPNERGNYPVEALDIILARKFLRRRWAACLTQAELARRAGIRPETLNSIEQGKRCPSVRTVDKIDRALREAEKQKVTGTSGF